MEHLLLGVYIAAAVAVWVLAMCIVFPNLTTNLVVFKTTIRANWLYYTKSRELFARMESHYTLWYELKAKKDRDPNYVPPLEQSRNAIDDLGVMFHEVNRIMYNENTLGVYSKWVNLRAGIASLLKDIHVLSIPMPVLNDASADVAS